MNLYTREQLIAFELQVKELWEQGELPYLLHLCGGEEEIMISIFNRVSKGDWFFGSHRSHYLALMCGMPEEEVLDAIKRGDSMFLYSKEHRLYVSAILAGTCGIAAGVARAIKDAGGIEHVWCFLGDGAEDSGHLAEAVAYVRGHGLPCTFIVLDNDRQVDTDKLTRRGNFQMQWPSCVERYNYVPTWPHAGSACPTQITFKRTTPL
jgi:TPP-dependent pyruvate/acetoin dehydrogenase alpha subunit